MRRLLALLLLLLAGCDGGPCGLSPRASLPVALEDGIPVVAVTINARPARLVLDTGAQTFVLTEAAVARLALATHAGTPIDITGTGGSARGFAAILRGIELAPGFRLPDSLAAVIPARLPSPGGLPVDGLLGVGVLNRWEIDLDLPARRMVLHDGRACPGTPPGMGGHVVELPNIATQGGRFVVAVALDGRPLPALLDSGAQRSLLSDQAAAAAGVTPAMLQADKPQALAGVGAGLVVARRHRFASLRIADDVIAGPELVVTPQPLAPNEAVIGFDYLSRRRIWLSAARRLVFIGRE